MRIQVQCQRGEPRTFRLGERWLHVISVLDRAAENSLQRFRLLVADGREWERMAANDSRECRNCHEFQAMDFTRQSKRAADAHSTRLARGERTCIDCHKGVAHRLPDMTKQ